MLCLMTIPPATLFMCVWNVTAGSASRVAAATPSFPLVVIAFKRVGPLYARQRHFFWIHDKVLQNSAFYDELRFLFKLAFC